MIKRLTKLVNPVNPVHFYILFQIPLGNIEERGHAREFDAG